MKKLHFKILSVALFLIIVCGLYIYNLQNDLPGADDNASAVIGQVAPHYKPWFAGVGPELSKGTERILFGLQILGGATLFAVCFRLLQKTGNTSDKK